MAAQNRIHSGTVVFVACDIDGYASPAIEAIGDTATANVTLTDCVLGASVYNTLGIKVQEGASIVQDSKTHQAAADRVNLTLTRTQFDPAVEAAGGKSLRVGSSVIDQVTQVDSSFTSGTGSPAVVIFEDFPTLTSGGVASSEAFGTSAIKLVNRLAGVPIPSSEEFPGGNIAYDQTFLGTAIDSDESFGSSVLGLAGQITAGGVPSSEAFGTGQIKLSTTLIGHSVPSSEAFGASRLVLLLAGHAIATSEAFGVGTMRIVNTLLGVPIPSSEAFGVGQMGVEEFLVGGGVDSDEAFGVGNMRVHLPGSDDPPLLVTAGRVQPADEVVEGAELVATVGTWSDFPDSARFVWLADGDIVRDSGYQLDTWSDTYTPTGADVGKTITVAEYTSNINGEAGPATSHGSVSVLGLPPAFVGHEEVFGPMPTLPEACIALRDTIRLWLATYLRERERRSGRDYGSLPSLRGWRVFTESLDWEPGDQLPILVIVAPGIPDAPVLGVNGILRGRYEMGASIIVSGPDFDSTLALAGEYGAALRGVIAQHGMLGGAADATMILGERYDQLSTESARTIMAAEVVVSIRLRGGVALRGGGPAEPSADPLPPDDGGPILGTVATTELDLERV